MFDLNRPKRPPDGGGVVGAAVDVASDPVDAALCCASAPPCGLCCAGAPPGGDCVATANAGVLIGLPPPCGGAITRTPTFDGVAVRAVTAVIALATAAAARSISASSACENAGDGRTISTRPSTAGRTGAESTAPTSFADARDTTGGAGAR